MSKSKIVPSFNPTRDGMRNTITPLEDKGAVLQDYIVGDIVDMTVEEMQVRFNRGEEWKWLPSGKAMRLEKGIIPKSLLPGPSAWTDNVSATKRRKKHKQERQNKKAGRRA